ncbi:MAG: hypothetical protein V9G29_15515 [Burkholderiaceae bacterium]
MASVAFVAWALGRNPSLQVICASYGQDLAYKLAQDTRSIMQSDWYRRVFGHVLEGSRPAEADFKTNAGGGRFATSVGGVLTGCGGDLIIIDDPLKPDGAMSDAERKSANDWFDHTVISRRNDKNTGAIVIIMQRLHQDDLVGHVLEQGGWDTLVLPAIADICARRVRRHRPARACSEVQPRASRITRLGEEMERAVLCSASSLLARDRADPDIQSGCATPNPAAEARTGGAKQ